MVTSFSVSQSGYWSENLLKGIFSVCGLLSSFDRTFFIPRFLFDRKKGPQINCDFYNQMVEILAERAMFFSGTLIFSDIVFYSVLIFHMVVLWVLSVFMVFNVFFIDFFAQTMHFTFSLVHFLHLLLYIIFPEKKSSNPKFSVHCMH